MLNEHERNVVLQMALAALKGKKLPGEDEIGPEMKAAVEKEVESMKMLREALGEEIFSGIAFDVEYDL